MFNLDEDKTIHVSRGDAVAFAVSATDQNGEDYVLKPGDTVRLLVVGKKDYGRVVLEKLFEVESETTKMNISLTEEETMIGDTISKPVDYWYEVELNSLTDPQTIIGYDEDGAKVFRLYP